MKLFQFRGPAARLCANRCLLPVHEWLEGQADGAGNSETNLKKKRQKEVSKRFLIQLVDSLSYDYNFQSLEACGGSFS